MPQPYQVFTMYAREDAQYLDELRGQLRPLENAGRIKVWSDREINPGADWEKAIVQKLDTADIILILVSSAYFNSAFIHEVEIKYALKRHEAGETRVLPIIVRPCAFGDDPVISRLQALPTDGKAVTDQRYWPERDNAWLDVVTGVKLTLNLLEKAEKDKQQAVLDARLQEEAAIEQAQKDAERGETERLKAEKRAQDAAKRRERDAASKAAEAKRLQTEKTAEEAAWKKALAANTVPGFEAYRSQFPQSTYAREALARIKTLNKDDGSLSTFGKYGAFGAGLLLVALAIWSTPKLIDSVFGVEKSDIQIVDSTQFGGIKIGVRKPSDTTSTGQQGLRPLPRSGMPANVTVGTAVNKNAVQDPSQKVSIEAVEKLIGKSKSSGGSSLKTVNVPTTFSPNGDFVNDILLVHGQKNATALLFKVYDRWGALVYEAKDFALNDPKKGWNGTFRGKPMDPGVFSWILEVKYVDGAKAQYKGNTTLIR